MKHIKKFFEWLFLCLVVLLAILFDKIHRFLRWWSYVSFHQVIMNDSDFHEDEISLVKFIWLICNLVPVNGLYVPINPVKRGLYIVDGRINRISFESNFINQVKSEEL